MSGKKQHYLQKAYLASFASGSIGNRPNIWAFDKFTQKSKEWGIHYVCFENYFFDYTDKDGQLVHVDDELITPLEKLLYPGFDAIRQNPIATTIDVHKRALAGFVALMLLRSISFRVHEKAAIDQVAKLMPGIEMQEVTEEDTKRRQHEYFKEAFDPTMNRLASMICTLLYNPNAKRLPFWASDRPYVMPGVGAEGDNSAGTFEGGTITRKTDASLLMRPEAQLILPIRPEVAILFTAPEASVADSLGPARALSPDEVRKINRAQVAWSLRYIFSHKRNFALAEEVLRDDPELGDPNYSPITLIPNNPAA